MLLTDTDGTGLSSLSQDNLFDDNSLYAQYKLAQANSTRNIETPAVGGRAVVNYADPQDQSVVSFGASSDPFIIDTDPTGEKVVAYGKSIGKPYTKDTILSLNLVGGKAVSRDWLMKSPEGRKLLAIASRDRAGRKRDFLESFSDVSYGDLPFMTLVGTQAGSISAAVRTADTFKKLQNGDTVTDEEALSATLAMAESRRSSEGTVGGMIGDIARQAPGFMLEFLATGGIGSGVRTGVTRAALRGAGAEVSSSAAHMLTRSGKVVSREMMTLEMANVVNAADKEASKAIIERVASGTYLNTMVENPLYKGISQDTLKSMARKRAEYDYAQYLARTQGGKVANGFNNFLQWSKNHLSRGLIDFGTWGTEESTIAFTSRTTAGRALSDAVGAMFVEAPLKGLAMWASNQYAVRPLIQAMTGNDRTVSKSQLSLMQTAWLTGNRELMDNAESISMAQDILEYVSENSGRAFSPLLRFTGLMVDKAGGAAAAAAGKKYLPLVAPPSKVIRGSGVPLTSEEVGVSIGGKIREWVRKILGTREDFNRRVAADKSLAATLSLGVTSEADKRAVSVAVKSGTTSGLRPELASVIESSGGMEKFLNRAVEQAYDKYRDQMMYKSLLRFQTANFMAKHGVNPQGIMNLYARMGYDGVLGEMFEERYSDVAKGLFGWDERTAEEKGFGKNLVQAAKNMYPGFKQLVAEAVGFAIPLFTRQVAMRMSAKVGGDSVISETKNMLAAMRDVTRVDELVQTDKKTYVESMKWMLGDAESTGLYQQEIDVAKAQYKKAKENGESEDVLKGIASNIAQMSKAYARRRQVHSKFMSSDEMARANDNDMIVLPLTTDAQLVSDDFNKRPVLTSSEAQQSLDARSALVQYAPKLARNLYEFQSAFEGEHKPWYRWFAQKAIGFTTGLVAGDFSAMSDNAVAWHARDYGLSREVCHSLRAAYAAEMDHQKKLMDDEIMGKIRNKEPLPSGYSESSAVFRHSREELMRRTDTAVAEASEQIMAAHVKASQFRTFTQDRIKAQAELVFAKELGYEATSKREGETITPAFYKVGKDGEFLPENEISVGELESLDTEGRIDEIAKDITKATINLMTRHLTRPEYAKSLLMGVARMPSGYDGVAPAVHEAAMAMLGKENLVNVIRADGDTPLKDLMTGSSVSRVNMDVVSYIANRASLDEDDSNLALALESIAQSLGATFDGTEEGLKKRNEKIFRLAKLANIVKDGNVKYYVGSTAMADDYDSRINSGNSFLVKAVKGNDGKYTVTYARDLAGDGKEVSTTPLDEQTLDNFMTSLGYAPATARVVFTQASAIEFTNMFTALRELNLVSEYKKACENAGAKQHPMLATSLGGYSNTEEEAEDKLADLIAKASHWDEVTQEPVNLPADLSAEKAREAWLDLYDPSTGFITIGERLLKRRGVASTDPIEKYSGSAMPYTGRRYVVSANVMRVGVDSGDVYVPIDYNSGYDYTTSIINAHLMDAFAKHPQLLKEALGGVVSDFVNDVNDCAEVLLRDDSVQKDTELRDEIEAFQAAYLKPCDRIVPRKDGGFERIRGRELTPASFSVLASQFALFRAGVSDVTGAYSRATAIMAPLVYRQPSFMSFMNLVDLTLGGSGFLNEMIASASKKSEEPAAQRGVRAILAAAEGNPDAFRNLVNEHVMTARGTTYDKFVADLVSNIDVIKKSGVTSLTNEDLDRAASRINSEARSNVTEQQLADTVRKVNESWQAKYKALDTELVNERSKRTEAESKISSLTDSYRTLHQQRIAAEAQLATARAAAVAALEALQEVKLNNDTESIHNENVEKALRAFNLAVEDERKAKDALRSALLAGRVVVDGVKIENGTVSTIDADTADASAPGEDLEDTGSDVDLDSMGYDDATSIIGFGEFQEELPEIFSEKNDGNPLHIRYGAEQDLSQELTAAQAKLAVNQMVRAAVADGVPVSERNVVDYAKRIIRGLSDSDINQIREQYRKLSALYASRNRDLSGLDTIVTGDLWAEEDFDESATSADNFNEKSVAEFESNELKDFLGLAWKVSPETGRNFQALIVNIKELNRWQNNYMDQNPNAYSKESVAAVKFLHDLLNPRGSALGKDISERLAIFEEKLDRFDSHPEEIQGYVRQLLHGSKSGKALSRKGAFLLTYMLSLSSNDRKRFTLLVSNSFATTAIHREDRSGKMELRERPGDGRVSDQVVTDSFSSLVGMTRGEVLELADKIRGEFIGDKAKDLVAFLPSNRAGHKEGNEIDVIRRNGLAIAIKLRDVFGSESPMFSALTSPRALQYMAAMLDHGPQNVASTISELAESMSVHKYLDKMGDRTGVDFVDTIVSTMRVMAATGSGTITREEVAMWFIPAFMTGDPTLGKMSRSVNNSRITSPLMTLMSMYDGSLPKTIMRADFDPSNPNSTSSVAIASRGCIPLGNRFMDKEFERLCKAVYPEAEVLKWNPGKTYQQVMSECRVDMTWPDRFRTPVFAKSLSKTLSARGTLAACEKTFADKDSPVWYVPIYAGDKSSSVLMQLPSELRDRLSPGKEISDDTVITDVFGNEIKSTKFTRKANRVCELLGLAMLANDAKRAAVSSLECEGVSMRGVRKYTDGVPEFGENRMFVVMALDDGFTQEEMKGLTLMHGYGARQLKSIAKDRGSMDMKAHLIGTNGDTLSFIKSLTASTDLVVGKHGEKFAKGSALRTLMDWLEKKVTDPSSNGILTDWDSYKIGRATSKDLVSGNVTLMKMVYNHFVAQAKELKKQGKEVKFKLSGDELDAIFGDIPVPGQSSEDPAQPKTAKLSELLPGLRVESVDGLSADAIALSFTENDMLGYTVANVSHGSKEPATASRTPRNHVIDALTMAAAIARLGPNANLDPSVVKDAYELVAKWGLVASATVSDGKFMDAMAKASPAIAEMIRNGEDPNGQNVKDELVRVVNAKLRKSINMPMNAIDTALHTGCALRDKHGVVHDHTKSEMYRAMNRMSEWYKTGDEADFFGVARSLAWCNVNVFNQTFRHTWFLDEAAVTKMDGWLRGDTSFTQNESYERTERGKNYWAGTESLSGDRKIVVMLENVFTDLRYWETKKPAGYQKAVADIRAQIARMFQDQWGVHLIDRNDVNGKNYGKSWANTVSFFDLFRRDKSGARVFDRSAFRIDGDRVKLDADNTSRIALGGTLMGLPRTPSYNGSMWLQVVRAGLVVTERDPVVEGGGYLPGTSAAVMPDPGTLDILGCDHDGDKTKLYFFHSENDGDVQFTVLPELDSANYEKFRNNEDGERSRYREFCRSSDLYSRWYVDEDGKPVEISSTDPNEYDGEYLDISESTRKRTSNSLVDILFSLAYALPDYDENGNHLARPDRRVVFSGSAVARNTKAFPLNDANKAAMLESEKIPEGVLRDKKGGLKNRIANVRVMTVVSDGASDASGCRANIVSMMKDLHLMWATGYFFGKDSVFNDEADGDSLKRVLAWWNSTYHEDGISNATFDDMKEQMCSRLGWRAGMVDVLFTDILRNRNEDGTRGKMITSDDEFREVLKWYSERVNKRGSSRWWMNKSTDNTNEDYAREVGEFLGGAEFDGVRAVTTTSVMNALGLERNKKGECVLGDSPHRIAQAVHDAGGDLELLVRAGQFRGYNAISGYVMFLHTVDDAHLATAAKEFVNWAKVHTAIEDGRSFVRSFNLLNIDIGNDIESGRRDNSVKKFQEFMKDVAQRNTTNLGSYDIGPALQRMNVAMSAAYDVGDRIMTLATRAILAGERHDYNLEKIARQQLQLNGIPHGAKLVAELLTMDKIRTSGGNRLLLEANAQQVPYVLAALTGLPEVEGSPISGAEGMYKALEGMAKGVMSSRYGDKAKFHRDQYIFALRHAIESIFDVMYRLAVTSDEHRLSNNAFSFFRTEDDNKFFSVNNDGSVNTNAYGPFSSGLRRIIPSFRANTDGSMTAIRNSVERIIQGLSFSGERKNSLMDPSYKFMGGNSFSLTKENLEAMLKKAEDTESDKLKTIITEARDAVVGLSDALGDDVTITPAMLFGQLLPMYSVLTARTLGAPVPGSTSLFGLLPDRIYRSLSKEQVRNDSINPHVVDALIPINWSPRNNNKKWGLQQNSRALTPTTPAKIVETASKINAEAANRPADKAMGKIFADAAAELRGGEDLSDWRKNPDYRNTFDIFAAGGAIMDAVRAINAVPESQYAHPVAPTVSEVMADASKRDKGPAKKVPVTEDAARFARAIGAMAGSWAKVDAVGGNAFLVTGHLRGDMGVVDSKTGAAHKVVFLVTVGDDFVNDEETVAALADSYNFAASLCAATDFTFTDRNGGERPLTAERFMTLPKDVRMGFVRKYQVGAATSNKIDYTINGRGVATLCGAIHLNGSKNSTKVYHEYFHAMMRVYDALGMLTDEDRSALAQKFNKDGSKTWSVGTEEVMAERFRKWVHDNTSGKDSKESEDTHTIFQKIFDFLVGLLESLRGYFTYRDMPDDTLFKMAVHGIAQSSSDLRDAAARQVYRDKLGESLNTVDTVLGGAVNVSDIEVAEKIRSMTRSRLEAGATGTTFYEKLVRELMPDATDEQVSATMAKVKRETAAVERARKAGKPLPNTRTLNYLRGLLTNTLPATAEDKLSKMMASPSVSRLDLADLIDNDFVNVDVNDMNTSDELSKVMLDTLNSPSSTTADVRRALSDLVSLRTSMAEDAGHQFSEDIPEEADINAPLFTVVPGSEEDLEAQLHTAAKAGTVDLGPSSATAIGEAGTMIKNMVMDGLTRDGGPWAGRVADVFAALGNPKPSEALAVKSAVIAALRQAVQVLDPSSVDEKLSKKHIEESLAYEMTLRAYQSMESMFRKNGNAKDSKTDRIRKEDATAMDVAAWVLSREIKSPVKLVEHLFSRLSEISEGLGPAGTAEIDHLRNAFLDIRSRLSDPTGLKLYRRGSLGQVFNRLFASVRAGLVPADGSESYFDGEGRMKDLKPADKEADEHREYSGLIKAHRLSLNGCYGNPAVQGALKLAVRTAYQLSAMAKFLDECQETPTSAADIESYNSNMKYSKAKAIGDLDWYMSQSMSSSMLVDNRNLVEHFNQSYFIAANVDQWLSSMVRKSFGATDLKELFLAENREFASIKSEILRLENFFSFLFGSNVEQGGNILKLLEHDKQFKMQFGEIVHDMLGKGIKFDNYHKILSKVKMTREDLERVDMFMKMLSAYVQHQKGIVTGVDTFMFDSTTSADPSEYSWEAIKDKEEKTRHGGRPLTKFEESLWRMHSQLPEHVLNGSINLYDTVVNAVCDAVKAARQYKVTIERHLVSEPRSTYVNGVKQPRILQTSRTTVVDEREKNFHFSTFVLRELEKKGLIVAERDGNAVAHDGLPKLKRGTLVINVDQYNEHWLNSDTYIKLTSAEGGRTADMLKRENVAKAYMNVWRKAAAFTRKHAWLTEGDGKFLNTFGTSLPFFRGSGVFMYGAVRRDRELKRSYSKNLAKYVRGFRDGVLGAKAKEQIAGNDDVFEMMSFLHDMYDTPQVGVDLRDAIAAGKYERSAEGNKTDLVLSKDCTRADVAEAIYVKLLERTDREESGVPVRDSSYVSADELLSMYEEARGNPEDMFGGGTGLNDEQMFRLHGVLPSNDQLGHKIHKSIDGITNAVMHRSTLINMLLTPSADGTPVYYADPDELAADKSGIPDAFWSSLAHWWASVNGYTYDESMSGVQNAKQIYSIIKRQTKENSGKVTTAKDAHGVPCTHRYTALPDRDSDLVSINGWLVMDDENLGDDSSLMNAMVGGEAMGYLKQFCQSSRVLGFGGAKTRATLHRCLSWSKSLSVSFSFFFPLATRFESPIGAVGAMAVLSSNFKSVARPTKAVGTVVKELLDEHPDLNKAIQTVFGGQGWITKDFLGFSDILEMMDSNDPFLAELTSWADALGVRISDRFVNPIEPTKSIVESDIRELAKLLESSGNGELAATFTRKAKFIMTRGGEKAFSYALNVTKLATIAQMATKLRAQAAARGKAFDPIRDLRRYAGYINAEIGGIDPHRYAWATPMHRGIMNSLLFSWEWTRGAWEAGGGGVIEDLVLGGHNVTPEERKYLLGRWARMYGAIMLGVPALIQMTAWGLARAILALPWDGDDDDDDVSPQRRQYLKELREYVANSSPFTWNNESKTRYTAADITPLLKVIGSVNVDWLPMVDKGTTLADLKERHPFALSMIPAYTGSDYANRKTRSRRLYIHFGKQGWEFFRWFDAPRQQFFSKLSMPTQKILEGVFGRNLGYLDHALPWEKKGDFERWVDPSFNGALWNLGSAFLPFSVTGMARTGDAGALSMFGPVQYGASYTEINDRIAERLTEFATNDRKYYTQGYAHHGRKHKWMKVMLSDILEDARKNGIPEASLNSLIDTAAGQVASKMYGDLWEAIPDDPSSDFDASRINRIARTINRLGSGYASAKQSLKRHLTDKHKDWNDVLTPRQRAMYNMVIRGSLSSPYSVSSRIEEFRQAAEAENVTY